MREKDVRVPPECADSRILQHDNRPNFQSHVLIFELTADYKDHSKTPQARYSPSLSMCDFLRLQK